MFFNLFPCKVTKQCVMNPCNATFHWSVGPWSQCSKSCGPGFRRRKVRCLDRREGRVPREKCEQKDRPRRRESCFLRNCLPSDCAELKAQQEKRNSSSDSQLPDGNYTVNIHHFYEKHIHPGAGHWLPHRGVLPSDE